MKLTIENILGVRHVQLDLPLGKVVRVCGPNASGKSSLATAAQAVATGDANPLGLSAVAGRKAYCNDDSVDVKTERCQATLTLDDHTEIVWDARQPAISHPPAVRPPSNREAVGLVDFTATRSNKERAELFQATLMPDRDTVLQTTREHLEKLLTDAETLEGVMKELTERDFDDAEKIFLERARRAKADWRGVTGQNYGVKVAANWRPTNWLAPYDTMSVVDAEREVSVQRDALVALHQVRAVSEAEAQRIADAKASLPALEDKVARHEKYVADAAEQMVEPQRQRDALLERKRDLQTQVEDANEQINTLTDDEVEAHECPHCKKKLYLHRDITSGDTEVRPFDDAVEQARKDDLDAAHSEYNDRNKELQELIVEIDEHKKAFAAAEGELKKSQISLAEVKAELSRTRKLADTEAEVETPEHRKAIADGEHAVEEAKSALAAVRAVEQATKLHQSVVSYSDIVAALSPNGIRANLIGRNVKRANALLRKMDDLTGWRQVELSTDGTVVTSGDGDARHRPVQLCSESEQWRAQAMIQIALALLSGSTLVVLDRADVLDDDELPALTKLANTAHQGKLAILICETTLNVEGLPDGTVRLDHGELVE